METSQPASQPDLETRLNRLQSVLREIIARSPFSLTFSVHKADSPSEDPEGPEYVVDFSGPDADLLLEKNGNLLHALEYVSLKAIRLEDEHLRLIGFDCNDWRRMRIEELRLMAQVAAERAVDTGVPFALSPMNARERRIIHLALRDYPQVRTQSEGVGPERRVVILPAGQRANEPSGH